MSANTIPKYINFPININALILLTAIDTIVIASTIIDWAIWQKITSENISWKTRIVLSV